MNISNKIFGLSLCFVIFISFNANSSIGENLKNDSNLEQNPVIETQLSNLLEPFTLLNSPILTEQVQSQLSVTESVDQL
jgi:hypothetical protein